MNGCTPEEIKREEREARRYARPTSAPCFVSVLLDDLAYGGREEGGWYYNTTERIETHYAANDAVLARIMERVNREYSNEGRYPISSVLSEGEYRIRLSWDVPPKYYPETRPRYE